jgi:hypothetical protein
MTEIYSECLPVSGITESPVIMSLNHGIVVSLKDIVDELEVLMDESTAYLNRQTGEVITVTHEDMRWVEGEEDLDLDEFPDWQREWLTKVQEILKSEDYMALPTKFDIHEYEIMKRFCLSIEEDMLRDDLLDAIQGSGAFRRFKNMIYRRGMENTWYRLRRAALKEIAIEWLTEHGIVYKGRE